jgi:hypothetical protein
MMKQSEKLRYLSLIVLLSLAALAGQASASDAEPLLLGGKLKPGNTLTDAATFVKDTDLRDAAISDIAADRLSMLVDLQNATALPTDVKKFFADRATVFALRPTIQLDRRQLRVDVRPGTGPLVKPVKGVADLNTAVTQFFIDFDARVAAEAAIDNDYAAIKASVARQDTASVTSNANQYFKDRFAHAQAVRNEAADVFTIKKDVSFKAQKIAFVKPSKGNDLTGHTKMFLDDRATWLTDNDAITAARNNMRSAVGTSSLEAAVLVWLNARHQHHHDGVQLGLDRFAMKLDVGLAKQKEPVTKTTQSKAPGVEDNSERPDPNLDESSEDNGEK